MKLVSMLLLVLMQRSMCDFLINILLNGLTRLGVVGGSGVGDGDEDELASRSPTPTANISLEVSFHPSLDKFYDFLYLNFFCC